MITITYHNVAKRTGRVDGVKSWTQAAYAIGDKPPNYPMPAIIFDVYHWPNQTHIWERTNTNYAFNRLVRVCK